jgi:hypothetical protein
MGVTLMAVVMSGVVMIMPCVIVVMIMRFNGFKGGFCFEGEGCFDGF